MSPTDDPGCAGGLCIASVDRFVAWTGVYFGPGASAATSWP
jgi:hypothetical protein